MVSGNQWAPPACWGAPHTVCRYLIGAPKPASVSLGREPVAVPDDVGEGAGVPPIRPVHGPGHAQALGTAKAPVQIAAAGLERHQRQLRGGQLDLGPACLQLAEDRGLDLAVHGPERRAGQRLLRDDRPGPVIDPGARPLQEVGQEIGRHGEAGADEPGRDLAAQGLVGGEGGAVTAGGRRLGVRVLAAVGRHGMGPGDGDGRRRPGGMNRADGMNGGMNGRVFCTGRGGPGAATTRSSLPAPRPGPLPPGRGKRRRRPVSWPAADRDAP